MRPTGDRIRETLFNWLTASVRGARVLDLYAGTGALGLEALSRGAAHVDLVEPNPRVARALAARVVEWGLENVDVHASTAEAFLKESTGPWDIILLDPPFADLLGQTVVAALTDSERFPAGCLVYLERPKDSAQLLPRRFVEQKTGQAGQVEYGLYRAGSADAA